jgi:hypothetical protein
VQGWHARGWPWALAGLWLLAALVRGWLWPGDPLGFTLARDWGTPPGQVVPPLSFLPGLWAQAPLAHAALWPAAALGPVPFHLAQAGLAAFVAPAAALAVAAAGAGRGWAVAGGLLAAAHPAALAAGPGPVALALPLLLSGLAASAAQRHGPATALLAAGGAMSVAVALAALPLAAFAAVVAFRRGEARWWPLQLDLRTTALLWGGLAGLVPAAYAWLVLDVGAGAAEAWKDALAPLGLLALVGLAGLATVGARPWAVAGLGCATLLVPSVAAGVVDGATLAVPAVLLLVVGVVLGAAAARPIALRARAVAAGSMASRAVAYRSVAVAAAIALAFAASAGAGLGGLALPGTAGTSGAGSGAGSGSASEALALVPEGLRGDLFAVDPRWQDVAWIAGEVGFLGWALSEGITDTEPWSAAVEDLADATLLRVRDTRLNAALREVYEDCIVATGAGHVVIVGRDCQGRGQALRAAVAQPGS